MKVSATGNTYKQVSFGRSLTRDEMHNAYDVAQNVRELMGAKDGTGVLVLPSSKLPKADNGNIKEQLDNFFDFVKNLLGINAVEVVGDTDDAIKEQVETSIKDNGLKKFVRFLIPSNPDELETAAEEAAKNADGLRVVTNNDSDVKQQISTIEDVFKKVKGEQYNPKMLMYEHNNQAYVWEGTNRISDAYSGKVIVGSSNCLNKNSGLWGSVTFYTDRMQAKQGDFIHGLRSAFDNTSLANQMQNVDEIKQGEKLLEEELKLYDDEILHPARFAAAKRADVALSHNFYKHYDDIIPGVNANISGFERAYNEALQNGTGDNYFDSLARVMKALGLEKTNPEVYETVCGYRNALYAAGAKTADELASVAAEELEASRKNVSNVVLEGTEVRKKIIEDANKLAEFRAKQKKILEEGLSAKTKINPVELTNFDKIINYVRNHKTYFIVGGLAAALLAIGGTMYSYGKEVAAKTESGRPKTDIIA